MMMVRLKSSGRLSVSDIFVRAVLGKSQRILLEQYILGLTVGAKILRLIFLASRYDSHFGKINI